MAKQSQVFVILNEVKDLRRKNKFMTKEDILKKIHENKAVLKRLGVKRLALFGSHARGEATSKSDLDFLVDLTRKLSTLTSISKSFLKTSFSVK